MASSKKKEPHGSPCPTPVRVDATVIPALLRIELGYQRRVVETERIIDNAVTCAIESIFDIN